MPASPIVAANAAGSGKRMASRSIERRTREVSIQVERDRPGQMLALERLGHRPTRTPSDVGDHDAIGALFEQPCQA